MATYERLDYGSEDGCQIGGAATDKIGFFGTTPADQRAASSQAALTLTTVTATSPYGLATATGMSALVAQVEEIRATLAELGLFKGAA